MADDNKILQLKLQLQHLHQTHQPILAENCQLKDQIIDINKRIEGCKLRLLRLVSDVSPQGEDRTILKAVCDLETVCCMLEEEFSDHLNSITKHRAINMDLNRNLEEEIKLMRQKQLLFEADRRNYELQMNQLRLVQKSQIDDKNTLIENLKMKIEDLLCRISFFDDRMNSVRTSLEAKTEQLKEIFQSKEKVLQNQIDDRNSYYEEIIDQIKVDFSDKLILKDKQMSDQALNFEQRINQLNQESIIKLNVSLLELKSQKMLVSELNAKLKTLSNQIKDREGQINGKQIQNIHLTTQVNELKIQLTDIRNLRQKELKLSQEEIRLLEQKVRKLMAGREGVYLHTSDQSVQVESTELEDKKSRMSTPQKNSKSMNQSVRFIKQYQMTSEIIQPKNKTQSVSVEKQSKPSSRKSSSRQKVQSQSVDQSSQTDPIQSNLETQPLKISIVEQQMNSYPRTYQEKQNTPQSQIKSQRYSPRSPILPILLGHKDMQDAICQCEIISEEQTKSQIQDEIDMLNNYHNQIMKEQDLKFQKSQRSLFEQVEQWRAQVGDLQDKLDKSESFNNALKIEVEELTREARIQKRENNRLLSIYNEAVKTSFESQNNNLSTLQEENKKLRFQLQINQENSNYLKDENLDLKLKLKSTKEEIQKHHEDFARHQGELVRSYEMIKYIQLELENYKKIYNMFKPNSQETFNQNTQSIDSTMPLSPPNHRDQMKNLKHQYATADIQNPRAHLLSFHHQRYRMRPARVAGIQININNSILKGNHSPHGEKLNKILFNIDDQKQVRKEFLPKITRFHTDYEEQRSKSSCDELILLQASDKLLHNLRTRSTSPVWVQQKAAMSIIGKKKRSPRLQIK